LQDLVEAGAPREDAYKWVQENAMAAWEGDQPAQAGMSFRERVSRDSRIGGFLNGAALERTFDLARQLRSVDSIFARVFGQSTAQRTA
jgi:adenylosuccinate lyase